MDLRNSFCIIVVPSLNCKFFIAFAEYNLLICPLVYDRGSLFLCTYLL